MKTAIVIMTSVLLSGCSTGLTEKYRESDLIAVCHDGTWVVRSRQTKKLMVIKKDDGLLSDGYLTADVDVNVRAQDICR